MTDSSRTVLGRGDRAPNFALPAASAEGTVALADYLGRGPVFLTMLRGLYCPFCRRHVSQLRPACEALRASGVTLLGVVVASPERARQYFRHFPPCFPIGAAPDRAIHRAYGLPERIRPPDMHQTVERHAAEILRESGLQFSPGQAVEVFARSDGFEMTSEDDAEWRRPLQVTGDFLIGCDGLIRWARVDTILTEFPKVEDLVSLL
jgi:peroxiredoxin